MNLPISPSSSRPAATGLTAAAALAAGTKAYAAIVQVGVPAGILSTSLPQGTDILANWDVDGDSVVDFRFGWRQQQAAIDWQANVFPQGNAGNGVSFFTGGAGYRYADKFALAEAVASGGSFSPNAGLVIIASRYNNANYGEFLPPGSRGFLGFRFVAGDSQTHYGWIELQPNRAAAAGDPGLQFFSAAYESTPGQAIAAGAVPEPGTLASLAFGAASLMLRRRRPENNA